MSARVIVSFALASTLLTACGPTAEQVQTAIAQTQAIIPTATVEPTATPKPITGADLEPLLLQDGDLPSSYLAQQFDANPPPYWGEPSIYRRLGVSLDFRGDQGIGVEVGTYPESVDPAVFGNIMGASGESIDGLGDESRFSRYPMNIGHVKLVWRKCTYVASIDIMLDYNGDERPAITYALRLDERLAEVLCP